MFKELDVKRFISDDMLVVKNVSKEEDNLNGISHIYGKHMDK